MYIFERLPTSQKDMHCLDNYRNPIDYYSPILEDDEEYLPPIIDDILSPKPSYKYLRLSPILEIPQAIDLDDDLQLDGLKRVIKLFIIMLEDDSPFFERLSFVRMTTHICNVYGLPMFQRGPICTPQEYYAEMYGKSDVGYIRLMHLLEAIYNNFSREDSMNIARIGCLPTASQLQDIANYMLKN